MIKRHEQWVKVFLEEMRWWVLGGETWGWFFRRTDEVEQFYNTFGYISFNKDKSRRGWN